MSLVIELLVLSINYSYCTPHINHTNQLNPKQAFFLKENVSLISLPSTKRMTTSPQHSLHPSDLLRRDVKDPTNSLNKKSCSAMPCAIQQSPII